ncbi:hypothetical protein Q763_06105 [Flavobacterium beibuense F44-8]|uniref:Pyrrolo-quinoline quinone n=1 Tax=Flavobacterium beibuense F44-8 TaxID=1406840 RepID=A0A0A2LTX3_9FLAO|nr:hypothetical protein [Flavobacterium beibuense]KGO82663.1 hypothetical protein Q763_06105 [Flavobacterium beibuense F44-8]
MNYNFFKYNNHRVTSIPNGDVELILKPMETGLSALPLVVEGKILLAYGNKKIVLKDSITNNTLWSITLPYVIRDSLIHGEQIFLSNNTSLFVLNFKTGAITAKEDNCNPNLINAVVYEKYIIWPTFIDNTNKVMIFDTAERKVSGSYTLPGIASFMLLEENNIIYNTYPNKIYSQKAINAEKNWEQVITQKNPAEEFVNDYPFIINNSIFLTLFPHTVKSYNLITGALNWEFSSGTGINSFSANFCNDNEIALFSGNTIFHLDSKNGNLIKKTELGGALGISSGAYQLSFTDGKKAVFYSYTLQNIIVIDIITLKESKKISLKKGVKHPPFIANNKLFVLDKDGNLYY